MSSIKTSIRVLPSYNEFKTLPNYSSVTYNEAVEKYKGFSKDIGLPDHEIMITNPEYLTTQFTIFSIREGFSKYNNHTIIVLNDNNKEIYSCKKNTNGMIIYDNNNIPILNSKASVSLKKYKANLNDYYFTTEVRENVIISSEIYPNLTYGKINTEYHYSEDLEKIIYKTEFKNSITKEKEILEIRHFVDSSVYKVYCNVGKENETVICKITIYRREYTIEVAPKIDYMYMFAICIGIFSSLTIRQNQYINIK